MPSPYEWPKSRYIITNCGDSIPSPTKGISNVEENCWATRLDTSGAGNAQRNAEAKFPDGWYDVFIKAWSHPGYPDTAAVHDTVYVDNFGGYATHVSARLHTGSRDTTTGVVGDAGTNYTYVVTASDQHGNESLGSNRVGEHDFSTGGNTRNARVVRHAR